MGDRGPSKRQPYGQSPGKRGRRQQKASSSVSNGQVDESTVTGSSGQSPKTSRRFKRFAVLPSIRSRFSKDSSSSATSIADFSNANALVPQQQCPADSEHAGLASTTIPQGNGNAEHGYRFDGYSNPSTSSGGTNSTYELRDVSSPRLSQEDEIEELVRAVDNVNLRYNRSGQGYAIFSGNLHSGGGNQIVGSLVASDGEWGDVTGNHVYYMNNVTPSARGHQIIGQQVIDGAGVPYQGRFKKNENLGPGDQIVGMHYGAADPNVRYVSRTS